MSMMKSIDWGSKLSTTNITYRFVPGGNIIQGPTGTHQTYEWSSYEKAQFAKAFALLKTFLNVKFTEDLTPGGGMLKIASIFKANSGDLGAFGPPGITALGMNGEGIGEFNWNGQGWHWNRPGSGGLEQGGLGFQNILHEVGHGLGLAHPHDDGPGTGVSPVFPGVPEGQGFGAFGQHQHNQNIYTMMSYNKGWANGPAASRPSADFTYGHIGTPMAFDIAVLQKKYGANMNHRKGNDTYVLPDKNALGTYWSAIWDAGGIDTIRYNGTKSAVIDLRPATLAHAAGGGGYISHANGIAGGFTIANKVVIENAIGGRGADTITGNSANNTLTGNEGNDRIYGGAGGDRLYGGNGIDRLEGGNGNDRLYGGSDSDRLYGGAGDDRVYGGNHSDTIYGGAGGDRLYGDAGNDRLYGGNGNDLLYGGNGGDRLYGDAGNDQLYGGNNADLLYGGAGSDKLYGAAGNDRLYGGANNDHLYGGAGKDKLYGGAGHDRLYGGTGDDELYGGAGTDRAYFGGKMSDYSITQSGSRTIVTHKGNGPQGTDTLVGIEFIVFADQTIAI